MKKESCQHFIHGPAEEQALTNILSLMQNWRNFLLCLILSIYQAKNVVFYTIGTVK